MALRRNQRFPQTSRPNRTWAGSATAAFTAVAGAGTKVLLASFTLSSEGIDETILRNVGLLSVKTDQQVADEDQIGAFGIIRVTDTAFAAGAASVPGPITDSSDDGWMVYVPIAQSFLFGTAVGMQGNFAQGYPFDSKAKRIISGGSRVVLVVESTSGSAGFQIAFVMRLLSQVRGTR